MKINSKSYSPKYAVFLIVTALFLAGSLQTVVAQSQNSGIAPLRSDVGINGLTVNYHGLQNFTNHSNDTLHFDGSSELEFVFRDVRMVSQRIGVGFQLMTSFFTNGPNEGKSFGIGSWGIGPVVRAYPFKTDRFQPYVQANSLFGVGMGLGKLANTTNRGHGFRMRLGLRGGVAYRLIDNFGIFVEGGYDWESGALFKADARTLQLNIGLDLYLFN